MKKIKYIIIMLSLVSASGLFAQSGYLAATYNTAIPLGNSKDFISNASFRGFGVDGGYYVTKNLSVGLSFSWNGFYEDFPYQTYEVGTISITGLMWRYTNLFPLLATVKYYVPTGIEFQPYFGLGVGTVITNTTTDFGIYSNTYRAWTFGLTPEVGFLYWFNSQTGIKLDATYNWSTKADNIPSQSNIGIALGLIWKLGSSGELTFDN
jgi:outer membrane protein W